jgi:hypothetical protein
LLIAHAHLGLGEQADGDREDLFARQAGTSEVATQRTTQGGQSIAECNEVVELARVADPAPLGMIAVLLSSARIATGRLQMTARVGADPDIDPRGRDACSCANTVVAPNTETATPNAPAQVPNEGPFALSRTASPASRIALPVKPSI